MARYNQRFDHENPHTSPQGRQVLRALSDYKYTDHPCVWVPTRFLYAAYLTASGIPITPTGPLPARDQLSDLLTLRQFGRCLLDTYADHEPIKSRVCGTQYRGIRGLLGPFSVKTADYDDYPLRFCEYPPPNDWTHYDPYGMV